MNGALLSEVSMSYIEVVLGGKSIGIADQASIDPMVGCRNMCVGCYAAKTSRMGKSFYKDEPILKEFDYDVFIKSCKAAVRKGITVARLGKHCDPGDDICIGTTRQILEATAKEGVSCVLVSKSIGFDEATATVIRDGGHTLHISLGMITKALDNAYRIRTYRLYKSFGCRSKVRIVEDVTQPVPKEYLKKIDPDDVIVTPMRYTSKVDAALYDADLSKYRWHLGFYRPIAADPSWSIFSHSCGEIGESVLCCNCLVRQ